MNKVSYAITVKDEIDEIKHLVDLLINNKRVEEEIVVMMDNDGSEEVWEYLLSVEDKLGIINRLVFNSDFSEWKNKLNTLCSGEWILNIDADEFIHEELMINMPTLLENASRENIDAFSLCRKNLVNGLTAEWIKKWKWSVNEEGYINFPDRQFRLYKNTNEIKWEGKVHEKLVGYKNFHNLNDHDSLCIRHFKQIDKQIRQNKLYEEIK